VQKITLIRLRGYREWTESLGPRREHIIQTVQAKIHSALWKYFTSIGALPHHLRYDFSLALTTNIETGRVGEVVAKIKRISPVDVEFCEGVGRTPREAYENCGATPGESAGVSVVAHMDVVDSTAATNKNGPLYVYRLIQRTISTIDSGCENLGCLAFYLGGDNIMLLLPNVDAIYQVLRDVELSVRVGVGVAKKPYNAFVKATRGLDYMRVKGRVGVKVVK